MRCEQAYNHIYCSSLLTVFSIRSLHQIRIMIFDQSIQKAGVVICYANFLSRNIFLILYWFTCLKDIFTFKCIINLCNCWTLFDFSVLQFYSDNMTVVTFSIILFLVYLEHHSMLYFFKSNGLVQIKTSFSWTIHARLIFLCLNGFQISKL